jgi:hypothetical protein
MTLENMLRKKLADPPAEGGTAVVAHQGWNVTLRPQASDALSASLWDVTVERETPAAGSDVRAWAERISSRVTGLLEPLKVLEVDPDGQVAVLRSTSPTPRDPGLHYNEVELHGTNRATVRRYRGFHEAGRKREQIPFAVTHEALAKLIDDITGEK